MSIWGFLLLGFALAIDCFSVSITCGMIEKRMGRQAVVMALLFGFFQALMPCIGWLFIDLFAHSIEDYDHWIAFGLLLLLGLRMIWSGFQKQDEAATFNPSRPHVLLTLAIATSIDALAVGFTFIGMGIRTAADAVLPLLIIGLVSAGMSLVGKYIGITIGRRFHFPAEPIGGLILIAIGIKVLTQHLCA